MQAICTNCRQELGDLEHGLPCPACGDSRRTYFVTAHAVATSTASAALSVEYAQSRPWQEQWRLVVSTLAVLEATYKGRPGGPFDGDAWKRQPADFCEACLRLREWIQKDPAVPPAAAEQAEHHAGSSRPIKLAGDLANTHKHRTRDNRGRDARVGGMETFNRDGLIGAAFRIDFDAWKADAAGSQDALDLARRTVEEWRRFFVAWGLHETAP